MWAAAMLLCLMREVNGGAAAAILHDLGVKPKPKARSGLGRV